jgi:TPR repeat protein
MCYPFGSFKEYLNVNPYLQTVFFFIVHRFGVASWYLTGNPDARVPQSDALAFQWMSKAADSGLLKAYFAMGYFYEEGIGNPGDLVQALVWYEKSLQKGDKRAETKIKSLKGQLEPAPAEPNKRQPRAPPKPKKTAAEIAAEREKARKARTGEDACMIM